MVTNTFNPPDPPCLVNSPQSIILKCQQVHYIPFTEQLWFWIFWTSVHVKIIDTWMPLRNNDYKITFKLPNHYVVVW